MALRRTDDYEPIALILPRLSCGLDLNAWSCGRFRILGSSQLRLVSLGGQHRSQSETVRLLSTVDQANPPSSEGRHSGFRQADPDHCGRDVRPDADPVAKGRAWALVDGRSCMG